MVVVITNYNNGQSERTKEDILDILDVFLARGRITKEQYNELSDMIKDNE